MAEYCAVLKMMQKVSLNKQFISNKPAGISYFLVFQFHYFNSSCSFPFLVKLGEFYYWLRSQESLLPG